MSGEAASILATCLVTGIPDELPEMPQWDDTVDHAPARRQVLTQQEKQLAIRNALRYFPKHLHEILAQEFIKELNSFGRVIMWRYRPTESEFPHSIPGDKSRRWIWGRGCICGGSNIRPPSRMAARSVGTLRQRPRSTQMRHNWKSSDGDKPGSRAG